MKHRVTYDEADIRRLVTQDAEARGRRITSISIAYDRPSHPTATDPGMGVRVEVEYEEGARDILG